MTDAVNNVISVAVAFAYAWRSSRKPLTACRLTPRTARHPQGRDRGLGLGLLHDRQVEGDWRDMFDAPAHRVRAVFLGDAGVPDDHPGVLELNVFDGNVPEGPPPSPHAVTQPGMMAGGSPGSAALHGRLRTRRRPTPADHGKSAARDIRP
jgi:hypothetical protein